MHAKISYSKRAMKTDMEPSLTKVTATIQIHPESESMTAQAIAHVENAADHEIEFILAVEFSDSPGKFVIQEITQSGRPCLFRVGRDRVFVTPAEPEKEVEIKFVYAGKPRQDPDDFIRADETVLRMDGAWLPTISSNCTDFDVTIRHPSGYTFFGQGTWEGKRDIDEEWAESRWTLRSGNGFTVYGAPEYRVKKTKAGDTEIIIAVWPGDANLLDELSDMATSIMQRLTRAFESYPYPFVRIVESGRWDGKSGYGAISNVSIGYRKLREGVDKAMVAHELTHGWWGGVVPASHESVHRGQWNETLAEYTSSCALEAEDALALRKKWSQNYASLDESSDKPMLQIGSYTSHWKINEAITYHKGALLMTSLEDRIGPASLKKALGTFVKRRAGKPSGWEDLLSAIGEFGGADTVRWLRDWLSKASAPKLKLTELRSEEDLLTGKLIQEEPLFDGRVEIGFYRDETLLGIEWASFKDEVNPFYVSLPSGTNKIRLDPRFRMPRRYDPDTPASYRL
jgi:aminopeptidase N